MVNKFPYLLFQQFRQKAKIFLQVSTLTEGHSQELWIETDSMSLLEFRGAMRDTSNGLSFYTEFYSE